MAGRIDGIMRAVQATPWAIERQKLDAILDFLELRASGVQLTESEIQAAVGDRNRSGLRQQGAVAVIPLYGVVAQRMNLMTAISGGTSTEQFSADFDELVKNPDIAAIVIDCDSPGGAVPGVQELSARIFAARGTKPIIAVANSLMASAAYWICTAADEVVATPSADVGSVGVFMVHTDLSGSDEQAGIKRTLISAGKYKTEGNPYEPLSAAAVAALQERVDETYDRFTADVARNRGVTVAEVKKGYGEGRVLSAQKALAAGMVDRVATLEDVIDGLIGSTSQKGTPARARGRRAETAPVLAPAASIADVEFPGVLDVVGSVAVLTALFGATAPAAESGQAPAGEAKGKSMPMDDDKECEDPDNDEGNEPDADPDDELEDEQKQDSKKKQKSHSDVGGAAAAVETVTPPAPTAPREAKEDTVDVKDTAAQNGAATLEARTAERQRIRTITKLAADHGIEDQAKIDSWLDAGLTVEQVEGAILRERYAADAGRAGSVQVSVGDTREALKPFATFGEQLMAIKNSSLPGATADVRLLRLNQLAGPAGANSNVPSEGGFLVQPDFAAGILERSYQLGEINSRVRRIPIGADKNGLKLTAVAETSRATGSRYGGIQVYWEGEGLQPPTAMPKWRQMDLTLRKLIGIMPVTDELLMDSTALGAVAQQGFAEEITFMTEDAIVRGDGVAKPLGFLNADSLVTVAKETSQATGTIVTANVLKMYSRLWARSRGNACWFVSQDAEPQLYQLTLGSGTAVILLYTPAGNGSKYGRLLGLPVIPVEYADTVGNLGDITLVDLDQYIAIDKGGVNSAWSIHVYFLTDQQAFRITYRVDGQPGWNKALTPYKGSSTVSPFVALAARP